MALPKVPSTALYQFFRRSITKLYYFEPEKQLRLAKFYMNGGTFNFAIGFVAGIITSKNVWEKKKFYT